MIFTISNEVLDSLFENFNLKYINQSKSELKFFDTYNNDLYKNGFFIQKDRLRYELKDLKNKLITQEESKNIKFYWDCANLYFKDILKEFAGYSSIMQKDKLKLHSKHYLAQNDNNKGIFRLSIHHFNDIIAVEIEQIKGYKQQFIDVQKFLSEHDSKESLFDFIKPEISQQKKQKINSETDSKVAVKTLLQNLYPVFKEQENGIINNIDTEFLHEYRVNLRKARAIISQFKSIFNESEILEFKNNLSLIARETNHARDLDVYYLKVLEYEEQNPDVDLNAFKEFLLHNSKKEYKKLSILLKSNKYKNICRDYENFINMVDGQNSINFKILVNKKLKKMYKKIINDGKSLSKSSEDALFHALRIDFKKFRYLLEFSEDLFDKSILLSAVKLTKTIQSILGSFQDLSIQQEKIKTLAQELYESKSQKDCSIFLSIGIMIKDLSLEQKECKDLFFEAFENFNKSQNQEIFLKLLFKDS